jgi:hypothetical protein
MKEVQPLVGSAGTEARLAAAAPDRLKDQDASVLSDYGLGLLSPSLCQRLIQAAKHAGKTRSGGSPFERILPPFAVPPWLSQIGQTCWPRFAIIPTLCSNQ